MILTVEELKAQVDVGEMTDDVIVARLEAIEKVIRKYTHNNFQNQKVRFIASTQNNIINGMSPFIKSGDTVQISQTVANDGLYIVTDVTDTNTVVEGMLYDETRNVVTKIEYPTDVKQCAIDLFKWKLEFGQKIGIKSESETLSRHSVSVTYEDSQTLFMGYPVGILSGLSLHKKARF